MTDSTLLGTVIPRRKASIPEENILELEYTDAPKTEKPAEITGMMKCPQCGVSLPDEAESCSNCDWTRQRKEETAEGKASDAVAVLLSVLPGLGHIYKGHRVLGLLLIFAGTPMALGIALLIATGTAGFGIFLLPVYWIAVMVHVYATQDRVVPSKEDPGEEY